MKPDRHAVLVFETINLEETGITFHPKLRKGLLEEKFLKAQFDNPDYNLLPYIYPPIFIRQGKKYQLIARYFSYAFFINRYIADSINFPSMPALTTSDEGTIDKILMAEEMEISFFSNLNNTVQISGGSGEHKPSKTTVYRHKAINAGRICPFCREALQEPRKKVEREKRLVRCFNKSKGCDFQVDLTVWEFAKFTKYELQTKQWIKKLSNEICPECGSDMYERMVHNSETDVEISHKCRNRDNSVKTKCAYEVQKTQI